MDRLNTQNNGGMPYVLDDLRFVESGYRDAIAAIAHGLLDGHKAVKFWGATLSDQNTYYQVSQGSIAIATEIFNVEAHQCQKGSQPYVWYIKEEVVKNKLYKDNVSHSAYLQRTMRYVNIDNLPAGAEYYGNVITLMEALRVNLNLNQATPWAAITLNEYVEHDPDFPVQCRRNTLNQIEIRGSFRYTSTPPLGVIGYVENNQLLPSHDISGSVFHLSDPVRRFILNKSGAVIMMNSSAGTLNNYELNLIER